MLRQHIAAMGEPLGRVYNALFNEVSIVHVTWRLYRQLYAQSAARVDLLNDTAGYFFATLQGILVDHVVLHIGRLTDRETVAGRDNLTIQRLPLLAPDVIRVDIGTLVANALTACEPVRLWRNRRLAHADLDVALFDATLPGLSRSDIETMLASLRAVMNRLAGHYWQTETRYEIAITPFGDADSLVFYLVKGLRVEKERQQRLEEGKALPEDLQSEELP